MDYIFPPDQSSASLIAELEKNGGCGQIVGPHGTGKTTLLYEITRELEKRGQGFRFVRLSAGQKSLAEAETVQFFHGESRNEAFQLLIVDGFEQLGFWERRELIREGKREKNRGLLITSHEKTSLPVLASTENKLDLLRQIVEKLGVEIEDQLLNEVYSQNSNIREMLFALYDRYERGEIKRASST